MELRDVLIILGIVLIAVIVWDGVRRMKLRKPKPRRSVTDLGPDPEEEKKKAELARELPNGGARIRDMTEEERDVISSKLNLRERVPMLMDSVDAEPESDRSAPAPFNDRAEQQALDFDREPEFKEDPKEPTGAASVTPDRQSEHPSLSAKDEAEHWNNDWHFSAVDEDESRGGSVPEMHGDETEERASEPSIDAQDPDRHGQEDEDSRDDVDDVDAPDPGLAEPQPQPVNEPTDSAVQNAEPEYKEDTRPVEELVIMHVMARDKGEIAGGDLLELLLRAGLRFGPLDIFHYRNPQGQMEFSLANCVQPGTLNPDAMDQMATPGVTIFMQLPLHADMMTSFDHMYEMAVYLSKNLDADLLDEEHSTVTPQRVEHYRERLRNFARSQLIQAHE
ncbi:cell division protein ZipA [Saccharospirillum impatiens]|uniref:cell division protein ZipA n=1 Tax=Saccharospirillum impatiens TaxID=169438 RepID=UPI000413884D|nr:cell division protein ZipA [Saccharospirillum impatiens]